MRARARLALAALAVSLTAAPAAALELTTTIDLDYMYTQEHLARDVEAATAYRQKYEVKYATSASVFDFTGAARLELEDSWDTNDAKGSRFAPTLELGAKSAQSAAKLTYQAVISRTEPFEESAANETYSTNAQADFQLTPVYWPEVKLLLQRRRDLDPGASDKLTRALELTARKDISGLVLEYDLKRDWSEEELPERGGTQSAEWAGKATYKEVLWAETEFELSYEITDLYERETRRGVFVADTEQTEQQLKTRLQKTLQLTPRSSLKLGWEYVFDQDLLGLEYDTTVANKYQALLRYDPLSWVKLSADYKRETKEERVPLPETDAAGLKDDLALAADVEPLSWLRIAHKAALRWSEDLKDGSGASVDRTREESYETVVRTKLGTWGELTANGASKREHEEGWLTKREGRFRGELRLQPFADLKIEPGYEVIRLTDWDVRIPDPTGQSQSREWKIKFDFTRQLLDLVKVTFLHQYGVKSEDKLDAALVFESTVQLNEETRLKLEVADLIAGLKLEGEIDRKASDTEDDSDPMIVDVSYTVKLDYKAEPLTVSSSFKYNDKGDAFDDLSFNAKLEWRAEALVLVGEYQFDKVLADETDEVRQMNLKLTYTF